MHNTPAPSHAPSGRQLRSTDVVAMLGLDNPSTGMDLMNNSTSLPPSLRFLHPDCKAYKAKHGEEVRERKLACSPHFV